MDRVGCPVVEAGVGTVSVDRGWWNTEEDRRFGGIGVKLGEKAEKITGEKDQRGEDRLREVEVREKE